MASIIDNHNSQVGDDKKIAVGTIQVSDDYIYRDFENYETSMSRLSDLVESYGGFLAIEYVHGDVVGSAIVGEAIVGYDTSTRVLNWYSGTSENSSQSIDFGENLLDIHRESDASDIITVLIPLGAEQENEDGTKTKLTIAELQEQLGKDYIEDAAGVSLYGRIVGTYQWNDVTDPANLLSKGLAYLHERTLGHIGIDISAIDLAGFNRTIESFKVGTAIHVKSSYHNIDAWFTCNQQTLDILDPTQNKLQLGSASSGYVSSSTHRQASLQRTTDYIYSTYAPGTRVSEYGRRIAEAELVIQSQTTSIEQNEREIALKASTEYVDQINGRITTAESTIAQNSDMIAMYFGRDGRISTWFTFDETSFQIGKSSSPIHSEQDNQSYKFVNDSGNVLLEINPNGTISQTVNVNAQVRYLDGATPQWATRKGKYITGKGVNLNDLWIGG